jgi:hypothetical protein
MHAARWRALHDVVVSSVNGHALSLVALAVGTPRTTNVRHRVKCVDRLLVSCPHCPRANFVASNSDFFSVFLIRATQNRSGAKNSRHF